MLLLDMRRPPDEPIADEDDDNPVGLDTQVEMAPAAAGSSVSAPLPASGASTGQGQQNDVDDEKDEKEEKDEIIDANDWHAHDDDDGQLSEHEYGAFSHKSSFDK